MPIHEARLRIEAGERPIHEARLRIEAGGDRTLILNTQLLTLTACCTPRWPRILHSDRARGVKSRTVAQTTLTRRLT